MRRVGQGESKARRCSEPPRQSNAAQRQSILVYTEGKKTEPVYLTHWHRIHRDRVIVTIDEFHGAPLQLATSSQISIAVTNPCIELWFLLHFQDHTADVHRHKAQEISSDLLGCAKVPTAAALIELVGRYEAARRRAQALDRKHELDGSPPRSNPSSSMWCLIDQIRGS